MRALLMGYYGARNLGDEMMLVCLRRWLEEQQISISVLSELPDEVQRRHGLPTVQNWPLLGQWSRRGAWLKGGAFQVVRAIARHDALIVGGGDLVRDDLGWRGFFFAMEKVIAALLLRKRLFFVNIGLGRPRTWYGRRLLRWALRRADRIIVRDRRSIEVCRECGAGDRACFLPDIVVTLPRLLGSPSSVTPGRYIVVAMRDASHVFRQFRLDDARLGHLAAALDETIERDDVDVWFVPFQTGAIDDNRMHQRIRSAMRRSDRTVLRAWTDDASEICGVLAAARGVLAMRLHAGILAAALGRPCVLLPYDHKLREFGELAGTPAIEADDLDDPTLIRSKLVSLSRRERRDPAAALGEIDHNSGWDEIRLVRPARGASPDPLSAQSPAALRQSVAHQEINP